MKKEDDNTLNFLDETLPPEDSKIDDDDESLSPVPEPKEDEKPKVKSARGRHKKDCNCGRCKGSQKIENTILRPGEPAAKNISENEYKSLVAFISSYLESRDSRLAFQEFEVDELSKILRDMFPEISISNPYLRLLVFTFGYLAFRPTVLEDVSPTFFPKLKYAFSWTKSKIIGLFKKPKTKK